MPAAVRSRRGCRALLALVLFASAASATEAIAGAPGDDPGVRAALRGADPAWYDGDRDGWKRIEPPADDAWSTARGVQAGTSVFAYAMYGVVAALVGLLAWQLWRLRGAAAAVDDTAPRRAAPVSVGGLPFALPSAGHEDPATALDAALAAGDWSRAVIWIYALELLAADRAGVLRLAAGKTNRGYLREVAGAPDAVRAALADTIAAFERSYFGHQPSDAAEVAALRQGYARLLAALPQPLDG